MIHNKIFTKEFLDFDLNSISNEVKKKLNGKKYADLIYLIFWCNSRHINSLKKNLVEGKVRLGRGLVFHICPSNVPTNFIYSFIFGLLSGNSNIVKVPTKDSPEKKIILSSIKKLFNQKKYLNLKNSNYFVQYNNEIEYTKDISSICDGRVVWGGDKAINEIRKFWIPERSVELTFSDRYSISLINLNELVNKKKKSITSIAKKFFFDTYLMNQAACNSPHFIFWLGNKNKYIQNKFWTELNEIVKKSFVLDEKGAVDKYSKLLENIIKQKNYLNIKKFKNNIYVVDPNKNIKNIENIRGINGIFFQKNISSINSLSQFVTKKCQTITYYGLNKNEFVQFILKNDLLGVDRIVPIGKALDISAIWDGYNVIESLSRIISLE